MNWQSVINWCHEFSGGRTVVHDEQRSDRPSLISDDHLQKIEGEIWANQHGMIESCITSFPKCLKTTIHEVVTEILGSGKLCPCWVPKTSPLHFWKHSSWMY
jgi:hypothetical protein